MKESSTGAGRSQINVITSSWRKLLSMGNKSNKQQQQQQPSSSTSPSATTISSSVEVLSESTEYVQQTALGHDENCLSVVGTLTDAPQVIPSFMSTVEGKSNNVPDEFNHNIHNTLTNNSSVGSYSQVEQTVKKPKAIMMRRRRSPKRKSTAMDTSDDEQQTSTPVNHNNIQKHTQSEPSTKLEPLFTPVHKPNNSNDQQLLNVSNSGQQGATLGSPKSDEDAVMDERYFSDTEMYVKKKDLLEYSKPIPAHFNTSTSASPFQKVFKKTGVFKPATPFPSPTSLMEIPSTHDYNQHNRQNDGDIPTAFYNLGLVGKLKEFCAAIPAYSMTSPVVYSPLDLAGNLDTLDTVYTCCGNNLFGQLGCGDKLKKTLAFQRRAKGPVKCIAGGNGFVLIATINNELFSCGDNSYGQCGLGPITKKHRPNFMKAIWDKKLEIKQIACGYHHSMILTTCGKVFSCGAGCAGALGLGDFTNRTTFQRVNIIFFGDEVDHIVCGMHYSAIISKSGRLFVTGVNISGELGVGDYVNRNLFTYVSEIPLQSNPNIAQISFRPGYSIIYTKYKQALIVGRTLGNRYVYVNGFPNNVKKIIFEGLHTIILCENGLLYKCNDDDVEFDSYQMPFFKFKLVNIPTRVVEIHSGIGYAVAVTEDNKFYGIGDKTWIFAVLYGKDKTDDSPMLPEFTKLRVDNFHNSVACGGTFTYCYTKSFKVSNNNSLIDRIQPLDPFQDIEIKIDTNKRIKTWSLSSVVSDYMINHKKKRKVETSSSSNSDCGDLNDFEGYDV